MGEFNSYLVPFAPFGMATVSRTLQPQLAEFLYALSASDGADPTRAADTGRDAARNGEPEGELGVVRQKDNAWQSQTGAPADPQAGNIPGGKRDVLRTANFNDGLLQAFAADSGTWAVSGGTLQVASTSNQADAVAVYQVGDALPSYYEVQASIQVVKPTQGWDANSYVIFDYQSATNFKFAGINVSTNKIEMGVRTAAGWQVLQQAAFPGSIRNDTWYNILLMVNGLTATLLVNNSNVFSYTYQATVVDGWSYGLNWGLVGFGSNKSRGAIDNVAVQIVPPAATVTRTDDFTTGLGVMGTAVANSALGGWTAAAGRLNGVPATGADTAIQLLNLSGVTQLATTSLLELSTVLKTTGRAGIVFDRYSDTDFKFAAVDVASKQVMIGHRSASGWTIDAVVSNTSLLSATDYKLGVTIKGSSVSVTLNDQAAVGFVFNAVGVDGRFGLFVRGTSASFDAVTVRTNDAAVPATQMTVAALGVTTLSETPTLDLAQAAPLFNEAYRRWATVEDALHLQALKAVRLAVADLPDGELAQYFEGTITLDVDAAGNGWFIDATPADNREFSGAGTVLQARSGDASARIDLLSVLAHEMGHAMGLAHAEGGVMSAELLPGQRSTPDLWARALPGRAWTPGQATPDIGKRQTAFAIDWDAERVTAQVPGPQNTAPAAAAKDWQQRFVNHLGASAERLQPNAGLRLHLPVTSGAVAKVSSR